VHRSHSCSIREFDIRHFFFDFRHPPFFPFDFFFSFLLRILCIIMNANCNFNSTPHIQAPSPYFNAVSYNQPQACSAPIPQTGPYWPTMQMPPQSPFHSGRPATPPADTLPDWAHSECLPQSTYDRAAVALKIAESGYMRLVQDKCAGLHLPWKVGYSLTHRHLLTQTLHDALLDVLEAQRVRKRKSIDQRGVLQFAELIEHTIFQYMARDPAEYDDLMAAKYDSFRFADFLYEERRLLQRFAWL